MNFTELIAWQKSRDFQKEMFELIKTWPAEERYRLSDQLIRSARSIAANIAEGHGRFHYQENIQYCRIARGSISESLSHLYAAHDCEYIDERTLNLHKNQLEDLTKILNGYINYIKKRKAT